MTPTQEALAIVESYLWAPQLEAQGYVLVGQEVPDPEAEEAAAYAYDSVTWAQHVLEQAASWPADYARAQLAKSMELLAEARRLAIRSGAEDLEYAIEVLSESTSNAIRDVGKGAGDGFRAYWGISPAAFLGGWGLFALAAGGLFLWGAPALIATTGTAVGRASLGIGRGVGAAAPLANALTSVGIKVG